MGIDESTKEIFVNSEENLSEKYDRMRKEKMERLYSEEFFEKLFYNILLYSFILKK